MADKHKQRIEHVASMAEEHGLVDQHFGTLIARINRALKTEFKEYDSGIGIGVADWHFRYGGVEYKMELAPFRSLDQKSPS